MEQSTVINVQHEGAQLLLSVLYNTAINTFYYFYSSYCIAHTLPQITVSNKAIVDSKFAPGAPS